MRTLKRQVKGGPGSGFAGHAGRPGLVGGSAPVGTLARTASVFRVDLNQRKEWADSLDDEFGPPIPPTKITELGKGTRPAFWLTPDGRLLQVPYHSLAFSKLGFSKDDINSYRRLTANGFARINLALSKDRKGARLWFELDAKELTSTTRNVLRDIYWSAKRGERDVQVETDYFNDAGDFVTAWDLDDFNSQLFKLNKELKGGVGSGHHGHVGRVGEVGGSAPAGTAPPRQRFGIRLLSQVGVDRLVKISKEEFKNFKAEDFAEEFSGQKNVRFWMLPDGTISEVDYHEDLTFSFGWSHIINADETAWVNGFIRGVYSDATDDRLGKGHLWLQLDGEVLTDITKNALRDLYWQAVARTGGGPENLVIIADFYDQDDKLTSVRNIEDFNILLFHLNKELKGGRGSGFHGHLGRPGLVGGSAPIGMTGQQRTEWLRDQGFEVIDLTASPTRSTNKPYANRPAYLDEDFDPETESMGIGWQNIDEEYEEHIQGIIDDLDIPYDHTDGITFTNNPPRRFEYDDTGGFTSLGGGRSFAGIYYRHNKTIHVRKQASSSVVIHEIAHHVDYTYGFRGSAAWAKAHRAFKKETKNLNPTEIGELTGLRPYSQSSSGEFFADCYMMMASGFAQENHLFKLAGYLGKDDYAVFDALFEEAVNA